MKHTLKKGCAIALLAVVSLPVLAADLNPFVVDGNEWMQSSAEERNAFLKGVANMIMAEGAYAKHTKNAMPPVSAQILKATESVKPAEFNARITRWYGANPGKLSTPVMVVVWRDIVKQQR
jgi:hypothetical protein